ncbi:filamin A-interacting protein 1-like [Xiphophorus maculatus]|uniref:Filamin A interacting protein 1 like n=1 Tax=Xiphophorus maculatus TaxID=8083 RepID=A0A3B5REX9_XIPMA|nr:filamin A-interacting protein 1-like [Xiphophorus maculatus]XP_023192567.1 filamin A-interacting protein 1-like [Xiphophorus maculatus]XP_023192568.1 filamin A-interacting protein 1-like [Xiphophorus maculatus]XP_023192569.1 filamin A-interacting protein 1-like [Xiphophorus maculatus]XP_023192570.1 filamin A-interacting protein 1-like [Xiphophorus maculatus]
MTVPSLLTEVEVLRKRVVEMEGKDEELIRMADQCRDLDRRLTNETRHCRGLKFEVDKLNGRICEMERMEEALGKSKQDCSILKSNLEKEREYSKMMSGELDALRIRVRELEAVEGRLESSEMIVRQDLGKLRALTAALVEDRKSMAEKLRQAEEKVSKKESKKNEQGNLAMMTERLREERQLALRSKADLEEKIKDIMKEKDELRDSLKTEEEKNRELQSKITTMKKKLSLFENRREKAEKYTSNTTHLCQTEDNKVKELTKELDELQKRLQNKEVLETELLKVEEDLEALERRLNDERRRSQVLTEELEEAKKELSSYKHGEKEEVNKEHLLLCHLQKEQVKSRLLTREMDTLKEKLQQLMRTEESICKVQMDQSTLQKKLSQQEAKNKELAQQMEKLTRELNGYRQMKNWTPGTNNHFSDLHQTTKEVQTDSGENLISTRNMHIERLSEVNTDKHLNPNTEVTNRESTLVSSINNFNTANNSMNSHAEVDMQQTVNGEVMMLTHTPGQPLQIKVTPHHMISTATLEITSPSGDTSTATIPTSGASPKQRITIIQSSSSPVANPKSPSSSPDRTLSPVNGTPISRVLSPKSSRSATPDNNSPIQIVTVRTCSPEPTEAANPAVFCKTPERSNSWQRQMSNSSDTSPNIITTEDSKIHIHLGSPYIHPLNGMGQSIPPPVGPYYLRHEQRTQVIANGCHVKGVGKITSSITISPANAHASHSNITVSGLYD